MAELHRVPVHHRLPTAWLPPIGGALAVLLGLAIVKPWGQPSPSEPAPSGGSPRASATPEPAPVRERGAYEPRLFGYREPDPQWELWPAGYVVEFGISGPLALGGPEGSPAPARSGAPPSGAPPSDAPPAEASPPSSAPDPDGTHVVDLGPTDHLVALGINTPLGTTVSEFRLWLLANANGRPGDHIAIPLVRLPTLWDSRHFHVIGVLDVRRPGQPGPWPVGEYRLDVVLALGETREVRFRVGAHSTAQQPAEGPAATPFSGWAAPETPRTRLGPA